MQKLMKSLNISDSLKKRNFMIKEHNNFCFLNRYGLKSEKSRHNGKYVESTAQDAGGSHYFSFI